MSDHDQLIAACARWERLNAEKDATIARLKAENVMLRAKYDGDLVDRLRDGIMATEAENAALRAAASVLPGEPQP